MTCITLAGLLQQTDRSIMVVLANESNTTTTSTVANQGAADALINTKKSLFVNSVSTNSGLGDRVFGFWFAIWLQ